MKIAEKRPALFIIFVVILIIGMVLFILGKSSHLSFNNPLDKSPQPTTFMTVAKPNQDTTSWKTFSDPKLKFSIKYPTGVILDPRETVTGQLYAFIFAEDKNITRMNTIPTLFIADTHSSNLDGFSAFQKSDCGKNCKASSTNVQWVNINNLYGIKNPLSNNIYNYYLTDKNQSGDVINVYVGNATNQNDKTSQTKIALFDQMIKTIQFVR